MSKMPLTEQSLLTSNNSLGGVLLQDTGTSGSGVAFNNQGFPSQVCGDAMVVNDQAVPIEFCVDNVQGAPVGVPSGGSLFLLGLGNTNRLRARRVDQNITRLPFKVIWFKPLGVA